MASDRTGTVSADDPGLACGFFHTLRSFSAGPLTGRAQLANRGLASLLSAGSMFPGFSDLSGDAADEATSSLRWALFSALGTLAHEFVGKLAAM